MMYQSFFLMESLALISSTVVFWVPLVYGSPGDQHVPGGFMILQESNVPFAPADRAPFPELDGWQSLGVKEAAMQHEIENMLSRKGYDPSKIEESLNEIDNKGNESPVFEAVPKYNPGTQMEGNPFPHLTSSTQNAGRQFIRDNDNILGLSERERGHHSSSFRVGKGPQQLVSKSVPTYPFWYHEPEKNLHLYAGLPSLAGSLFREPISKHTIKDLKEHESGHATVNPLFWTLENQISPFAKGIWDGILARKLFCEKFCALKRKQLFLGGPRPTNLRFATGEGDWVSKHESLHHPERKIPKPFYTSVLFPKLMTSIVTEVSGDGIKNDEPTQETLAQNDVGNPHTWMQIQDGPAEFLLRFPQAQTNDVQENASISKYQNSYHPEREIAKFFYEWKPLSQTSSMNAGIENNESARETRAQNDERNSHIGMQILDGPAEFMARFPQAQTNDIHENASVSKYENPYHSEKKTAEFVYKWEFDYEWKPPLFIYNCSSSELIGTGNNEPEQKTRAKNDEENPHTGTQILDEPAESMVRPPRAQTNDVYENASVSKYESSYYPEERPLKVVYKPPPPLQLRNCSLTEVKGADEPAQEPQADATVLRIKIRRARDEKKHKKHGKGYRKVVIYLHGDVNITTGNDAKNFILSIPLYETKSKEEGKSDRGFPR